jgi:hypothetical protein
MHTKGPWKYSRNNWRGEPSEVYWYITGDHREADEDEDEDSEPCGTCVGIARVEGNRTSHPICEDNARLMAASPDLLAALQRIVHNGFSAQAEEQAAAAIAKAAAASPVAIK